MACCRGLKIVVSSIEQPELLARILQGDQQALAVLFTSHRERLRRMVVFRLDRRLQGRLDADDVVQEAYLDAAQRLKHYDPSGSFFVWLRLVTTQTLATVHRRHFGAQIRDAKREVSLHGTPMATSIAIADRFLGQLTSPSQAALKRELAAQLEAALAEMNPVDQDVLAMRHFEDLTNSEIAEILGIEQNAASIRYVRAIERLKTILNRIPGFLEAR